MEEQEVLPCLCGIVPVMQKIESDNKFCLMCPKGAGGCVATECSMVVKCWNSMVKEMTACPLVRTK